MSKFSTHLSTLSRLVSVARRLANDGIPGGGNHWSETKAEMELDLGRPLNNEEVTLLSLSRAFGPTPSFSNELNPISRLWPHGNPRGLRYDWEQLTEELIRFRDGNDNAVFVYASGLQGVYIVELCEEPGCGYLAEEDGKLAWFGDAECPSSYEMAAIGWFGPDEGWTDAKQAIRSLNGYETDTELMIAVVRFQLLWDQGKMDEAEKLTQPWHAEAFNAQLWLDVTPQDAWNMVAAALYKLRAVVDDSQLHEALKVLGIE